MKVDYLSAEEYKELGLTSGIEIHQQIKTAKKLFCHCPVIMHKDNDFDAVVVRHMRPTLSELGEYDGTALMEFKTRKEVVYELYHDCVCTYEMDDTPPFMINQDAVDIALVVSLLLGCTMIDELFITRKQYLDGSIPTGFQRTCIVGIDGSIRHKGKRIHIRQLGLEEDACREVSDVGHRITFKADRLGMPLVEVVTERDMVTPWEVEDVAEQIGTSLKGMGLVHRGLGSVRQDVNVSIAGSTRVEIKGVPQVSLIGPLVHYEALRQKHLLEIKDELASRGITKECLRFWDRDITDVIGELDSNILKKGLESQPESCLVAMGLGKLAGLLSHELQPQKPFAYEISQRIKVIACLDDEPNIVWNDGRIRAGDLSDNAWSRVFLALGASRDDAVILVWGSRQDVRTAVSETQLRIEDAIDGVPNETRQAYENGTTGFERILPGPDRMYPDTDLPPIAISAERIERARSRIDTNPFEAFERFRHLGLPEEAIKQLMRTGKWKLFDRVVSELGVGPRFAAFVLTERLRWLERAGFDVSELSDDEVMEIFEAHKRGRLSQEAVSWVLRDIVAFDDALEVAMERYVLDSPGEEAVNEAVCERLKSRRDLLDVLPADKVFNVLMGDIMRSTRLKLEPRSVAKALRKGLSEVHESS